MAIAGSALGDTTLPGNIELQQSVTPSGSSSVQVKIPILPGAGGLEPKLSLAYSSQGGNAGYGLGWSLGGFQIVTRGGKTWSSDDGVSGVDLTSDDAFYLDGERLIREASPNASIAPCTTHGFSTPLAQAQHILRKESDDASRIFEFDDADGDAVKFVLETKSCVYTTFLPGRTIDRGTKPIPISYLPSETVDASGNFIRWQFDTAGLNGNKASYMLTSARYTGLYSASRTIEPFAEVDFCYVNGPSVDTFVMGLGVPQTNQFSYAIAHWTPTPDYACGRQVDGLKITPNYDPTNRADRYRLKSIDEGYVSSSGGTNLPPVSFAYADIKPEGWTSTPYTAPQQLPDLGAKVPPQGYQFAYGWCNGVPQRVLFAAFKSGTTLVAKAYAAPSWAACSPSDAPPIAFTDASGNPTGATLVHFNDGELDLIFSDGSSQSRAWRQASTGWNEIKPGAADQGYIPPANVDLRGSADVQALNLTNGTRTDVLLIPRTVGALETVDALISNQYPNTAASPGWTFEPSSTPNARFAFREALGKSVFADFDGNGRVDRAAIEGQYLTLYTNQGQGWVEQTPTAVGPALATATDIRLVRVGISSVPTVISGWRVGTQPNNYVETDYISYSDAAGTTWTTYPMHPGGSLFWQNGAPLYPRVMPLQDKRYDDLVFDTTIPGAAQAAATLLQQPAAMAGSPPQWTPQGGPQAILAGSANGPVQSVHSIDRGDGVSDIVVLPGAQQALAVYDYNGTSWGTSQTLKTPPVAFAVSGKNNDNVRFVDLFNNGLQDILYTQQGAKGDACCAYVNTGRGWSENVPALAPPSEIKSIGNIPSTVTVADVNGDGYPDLIYSYTSSSGSQQVTYINHIADLIDPQHPTTLQALRALPPGSIWKPDDNYKMPQYLWDEKKGDLGGRFVNFNGKTGRVSLVFATTDPNGKVTARRYDNRGPGRGWDSGSSITMPLAFVADDPNGNRALNTQVIAARGDRVPALVGSYNVGATPYSGVYPYDGSHSEFGSPIPGALPPGLRFDDTDNPVQFIDLNGGGVADIFQYTAPANGQCNDTDGAGKVYLAMLDGRWQDSEAAESKKWRLPCAAWSPTYGFAGLQFVTMSGQQYPDVAFRRPCDPSDKSCRGSFLNKGAGWVDATGTTYDPPADLVTADAGDTGVRFIDIDGNGSQDFVQSLDGTRTVMANANGRVGMLESITDSAGIETRYKYAALTQRVDNPPFKPDCPMRTLTGMQDTVFCPGKSYDVGPAPTLGDPVPAPSRAIALAPFSPVVASVSVDEINPDSKTSNPATTSSRARTSSYTYGDFEFDVVNGRALGFRWINRHDSATSFDDCTSYQQTYGLTGLPSVETVSADVSGAPEELARTTKIWQSGTSVFQSQDCAANPGAPPIAAIVPDPHNYLQPEVQSAETVKYDLQKADHNPKTLSDDIDQFWYDDWLNTAKTLTLRVEKTPAVPKVKVKSYLLVCNTFPQDPTAQRFGRLASSTSFAATKPHPELFPGVQPVCDADALKAALAGDIASDPVNHQGTVSRTAAFDYFGDSLLLADSIKNVGDGVLESKTSLIRDDRGNVETTIAGATNPQPRSTTITRDAALLRSTVETLDAESHKSTATNATSGSARDYGLALKTTDPNNLSTVLTYDDLGRLLTKTTPDGVVTHYERYRPCDLVGQQPDWLTGLDFVSPTCPTTRPRGKRAAPAARRMGVMPPDPSAVALGDSEAVCLSAPSGHAIVRRHARRKGRQARVAIPKDCQRLDSVAIRDAAGRTLRSVSLRTDGTAAKLVFRDSVYDLRGRLVQESAPYFTGTCPVWATYVYDALDRRTQEIHVKYETFVPGTCDPQNVQTTVTRTDFDGLTQTHTDAKGAQTVVVLSSSLKPLQIAIRECETCAPKSTTEYAYDALDHVVSVARKSSTLGDLVTTTRYDNAGNKIESDDPDLSTASDPGIVRFVYDEFGELTEQYYGNDRSHATKTTYDLLGRAETIKAPDKTVVWTFDTGKIGFPDSVKTTATLLDPAPHQNPDVIYQESYTYNQVAQLVQTDMVFQGVPAPNDPTQKSFKVVYDPFGAIGTITYPQSATGGDFAVQRAYDQATGQLTAVYEIDHRQHKPLWILRKADATGRSTQDGFGDGTEETRGFNAFTGMPASVQLVDGGRHLWDASFAYDDNGNLGDRGDAYVDEHAKSFSSKSHYTFDLENRLVQADESLASGGVTTGNTGAVTFDELGRISSKTNSSGFSPGSYRYWETAPSGSSPSGPTDHLHTVDGLSTGLLEYEDGRGNMTKRGTTTLQYTRDNHIATLDTSAPQTLGTYRDQFLYGQSGQRIYTEESKAQPNQLVRITRTLHMGLFDRIGVTYGSNEEYVTARYYVSATDGVFVAVDRVTKNNRPFRTAALYLHKDPQGSIAAVTSNVGGRVTVIAHYRFDPWGLRSGSTPFSGRDEAAWTKGFIGQDDLTASEDGEVFNFVHMNGRLYDPTLGIFLSADPVGSGPYVPAGLDPYLYGNGNPLSVADFSGYCWICDVVSSAGNAIGNAFNSAANAVASAVHDTGQWLGQNWREVAVVAVVAVVTVATGGSAGPVAVAMMAGAAGGATNAIVYNGNLHDVLEGALIGGAEGAIGSYLGGSDVGLGEQIIGRGLLGGLNDVAHGQSFAHGFEMGALTATLSGIDVTGLIANGDAWATAERVGLQAALNGTIAQIDGGKFANGALSGAFEQLSVDVSPQTWDNIQTFTDFAAIAQSRDAVMSAVGSGALLYGSAALFGYDSYLPDWNSALDHPLSFALGDSLSLSNVVLFGGCGATCNLQMWQHQGANALSLSAYGTTEFFNPYRDEFSGRNDDYRQFESTLIETMLQ